MLSSKLLISLCETDAEEVKFCHRNVNGSLSLTMLECHWDGEYHISCGKPIEGATYLICDALLEGCTPDLIYNNKGKDYESTMFGYIIDDAPAES
jgi:hypothetical protein